MRSSFKFSNGEQREGKTRYRAYGAERAARTIQANNNETLASITLRAYGANTAQNRAKITAANASLTGEIKVPK